MTIMEFKLIVIGTWALARSWTKVKEERKKGTVQSAGRCEKGHRKTKLGEGLYYCPICSPKKPEIVPKKPSFLRKLRWWLFSENSN